MKTKHTPGPWRVHREGTKVGVLTDNNVEHVATVHNVHRQEANARLIAAAPNLLATCQKLVTWLRSIREEDEVLVIEHGFDDGFNLTTAEGIIEEATQ